MFTIIRCTNGRMRPSGQTPWLWIHEKLLALVDPREIFGKDSEKASGNIRREFVS